MWNLSRRILYAGSSLGEVFCFKVPEVTSVNGDIGIVQERKFAAHKDVITDMLSVPDLDLLVNIGPPKFQVHSDFKSLSA